MSQLTNRQGEGRIGFDVHYDRENSFEHPFLPPTCTYAFEHLERHGKDCDSPSSLENNSHHILQSPPNIRSYRGNRVVRHVPVKYHQYNHFVVDYYFFFFCACACMKYRTLIFKNPWQLTEERGSRSDIIVLPEMLWKSFLKRSWFPFTEKNSLHEIIFYRSFSILDSSRSML